MKSHYETLGVRPDATDGEIKDAYRRLAIIEHPDQNMGDPAAAERFRAVQAAYEALADAERRRAYDESLGRPSAASRPRLLDPTRADEQTAARTAPSELSIGELLNDALELYTKYFWRFVLVAAVVFVPLDLLLAIAHQALRNGGAAGRIWLLISSFVQLVGVFWLQGALVEPVRDAYWRSFDTPVLEVFRRSRRFLGALVGTGIAAGVAEGIGLIAFVVPGVYLMVRLALLAPVIVLERKRGWAVFLRSWELTRGRTLRLLGVVLLLLLLQISGTEVISSVFVWAPPFLHTWLGGLLANSLVTPFIAVAWTLVYLRLAKER